MFYKLVNRDNSKMKSGMTENRYDVKMILKSNPSGILTKWPKRLKCPPTHHFLSFYHVLITWI